jgi:hypothetical protein
VIEVDCRVPPGHGEETRSRRIDEVLGDDGLPLEFSRRSSATRRRSSRR